MANKGKSKKNRIRAVAGTWGGGFTYEIGLALVDEQQDDTTDYKVEEAGPYMPPSPMRALYWNCCGFARAVAIRHLQKLVQQHLPEVLCIAETKIKGTKSMMQSLGFHDCFEIPPEGTSGGMTMA